MWLTDSGSIRMELKLDKYWWRFKIMLELYASLSNEGVGKVGANKVCP